MSHVSYFTLQSLKNTFDFMYPTGFTSLGVMFKERREGGGWWLFLSVQHTIGTPKIQV